MNIKSLLLGSAAALVAVSGARAADAVVIAEPEPLEYVRVCDTYGAGYYYIPGTETCLRVGGYVQYDIGVGDEGIGITSGDKSEFADTGVFDENDTYFKRARVSVQLDARSETELGTLRSYVELRFNDDQSTTSADGFSIQTQSYEVNHGYIELGGFRIGKTDSLFTTFTGYAGGVINDDIAVPYGPFDTNQIAYTFSGANGFAAAIALEEGGGGGLDIDGDGTNDVFVGDLYTIDSYMPHVVAGVSFTQGWGGVSAVVGYDSVWEEWAGKVRVDFNATEQLSLFAMAGYKSGADDDFFGFAGADTPNYYGQWSGDWAVWGGATYQATEKAAVNVQLAYDDAENFSAVANVAYTVVPGLVVTPEIVYADNFDIDDSDAFGGFMRFRRSF